MREYVHVDGPEGLTVFVDGGECGVTNTVLFVDTGTHIFSLVEDVTLPHGVEICVQETSDLRPLRIVLVAHSGVAAALGLEASDAPVSLEAGQTPDAAETAAGSPEGAD
jgi:hypothetical protein